MTQQNSESPTLHEEPTIDWLIDHIGDNSPLTQFNKKRLRNLITQERLRGQIEELENVQLEHGRYVTQTFANGQAMTIMERIGDLKAELTRLEGEK